MTRVWDELQHVITTVIVPGAVDRGRGLRLDRATSGSPCARACRRSTDDVRPSRLRRHRRVVAAHRGIGAARVPPELVARCARARVPDGRALHEHRGCVSTGTRIGDSDRRHLPPPSGRPNGGVELRLRRRPGAGRVVPGRARSAPSCLRGRGPMIARLLARSRAHRRGDRRPTAGCSPATSGWVGERRQPAPRRPQHRDVHPRWLQRVPDRGRERSRRPPGDRRQARWSAPPVDDAHRRDRRAVRRAARRQRSAELAEVRAFVQGAPGRLQGARRARWSSTSCR